jgi:hypothetical protein
LIVSFYCTSWKSWLNVMNECLLLLLLLLLFFILSFHLCFSTYPTIRLLSGCSAKMCEHFVCPRIMHDVLPYMLFPHSLYINLSTYKELL